MVDGVLEKDRLAYSDDGTYSERDSILNAYGLMQALPMDLRPTYLAALFQSIIILCHGLNLEMFSGNTLNSPYIRIFGLKHTILRTQLYNQCLLDVCNCHRRLSSPDGLRMR